MSEKTIGRWMKARGNRNSVILATKGAHPDLSAMHIPRLSRSDITKDLEESLKYLGVDHIDLYWLHRDDPNRDVCEIIETMDALVNSGKIRYYGLSNWKLPRLEEALAYAQGKGIARPSGSQILWSLAEPNADVFKDAPHCIHGCCNMGIPQQNQHGSCALYFAGQGLLHQAKQRRLHRHAGLGQGNLL